MTETPDCSTARADLAWGQITCKTGSGSFIEDRLRALVDVRSGAGRFPVDVIHPDATVGEAS